MSIYGLSQTASILIAAIPVAGTIAAAFLSGRAKKEASAAKVKVAEVTVAQEGNESAIHGLTSLADEQRADMLDMKADMRLVKTELRECHEDKRRLGERLKNDTASFNQGNLADKLRKEGYDELPLDELQDRLSKMFGLDRRHAQGAL